MQANNIAVYLWLCFVIFSFRVVGQLSVYWFDIPVLPAFDAWYSGAISYGFLVIWQLIIMVAMAVVALRISKNLVVPRHRLGNVLQIIGVIYFGIMLIRLLISVFGLSDAIWFNRPIPAFFHLVLASFLILCGRYHLRKMTAR